MGHATVTGPTNASVTIIIIDWPLPSVGQLSPCAAMIITRWNDHGCMGDARLLSEKVTSVRRYFMPRVVGASRRVWSLVQRREGVAVQARLVALVCV